MKESLAEMVITLKYRIDGFNRWEGYVVFHPCFASDKHLRTLKIFNMVICIMVLLLLFNGSILCYSSLFYFSGLIEFG